MMHVRPRTSELREVTDVQPEPLQRCFDFRRVFFVWIVLARD